MVMDAYINLFSSRVCVPIAEVSTELSKASSFLVSDYPKAEQGEYQHLYRPDLRCHINSAQDGLYNVSIEVLRRATDNEQLRSRQHSDYRCGRRTEKPDGDDVVIDWR